jgi:DNA polymerase lambda
MIHTLRDKTGLHVAQITKMGGTAVIEPDTGLTHVVYGGKAVANLVRDLGLSSIDDLPDGCVCVKWEWIANCKMAVST